MNSPAAFRRTLRSPGLVPSSQSPLLSKSQLLTSNQFSFNLKSDWFSKIITSSASEFPCRIRGGRYSRVRASSNDARSIGSRSSGGPFRDGTGELPEPSVAEFITSERVKVVAMLALALALCNADRVVMSVAIVPLSLSHGWRQSFAGVVQVIPFSFPFKR